MKVRRLTILLLAALLLILFLFSRAGTYIVIEDKKGNLVTIIPTQEEFSTLYMHSSEKQPWENIYRVNDDATLTLLTMKLRSLGPGVPYNVEKGWKFYIRDGYFIYDNINQRYDALEFSVSQISPHFIKENGKLYNLVDICGDNAEIKLMIRKGVSAKLRGWLTWMSTRSKKQ